MRKSNFSNTIIGEAGAEKLMGGGDMLFRMPSDGVKRIQGVNVTARDLQRLAGRIIRQSTASYESNKFSLDLGNMYETAVPDNVFFPDGKKVNAQKFKEQFFARILLWALRQDSVSGNQICDTFNVGWRRASKFLDRLNQLEVAGDLDAKLPRAILPRCVDDLSAEAVEILSCYGVVDEVYDAFKARK